MDQIISNPFAPTAYNGVVAAQADYVEEDVTYVFDQIVPASTTLNNLQVSLDRDADFLLMGVQISFLTSNQLLVQFQDNQGQNLQSDFVFAAAYTNSPFAINPFRLFSAGGQIIIRLRNESVADNTIQILFRGKKRYRLNS